MKLSILSTALLITLTNGFAVAFAPQINSNTHTTTTSLNLFGGKKDGAKADGGGGPGGGMMDQLAMFKKAQEIAQQKNKLDDELKGMDIIGTAADGKIKVTIKYSPAKMPTSPSPGYDAIDVDIDEEYLNEVSSDVLSEQLVEALRDGETRATEVVTEKYKSLEAALSGIMGGMTGGAPPA
eukprot:CAMPEP_0198260746 /NCGR_PEP_ID=MMETSP1447-20131203/9634_1 /TAXON_ID=420782 /ORGANISM="Chaetoceros dichaeta, Strain CCMP1751" /LENGTH=180 /DNA_ID=CAMNT_0043948471 /DNA_START=74 /DNA_END=616 /DNA_ORIENTATION=+